MASNLGTITCNPPSMFLMTMPRIPWNETKTCSTTDGIWRTVENGKFIEFSVALIVLSPDRSRTGDSEAMTKSALSLLIAALFFAPMANAEDYVTRDAKGQRTGTVEQDYGDEYVRRDPSGRRIGTIDDGIGDEKIIRDTSGRRTGTIEPGISGELIVRDQEGKRVQTLEPEVSGGYVIRDFNGRHIGTVERQ